MRAPGFFRSDEFVHRSVFFRSDRHAGQPNFIYICTEKPKITKTYQIMIDFLQAVPAEPQPGFMQQYSFLIMIGLMVLVLWLFMWRPEAKRRKQMQAFRDGLKKGDKVVTAGGIYGTVKEVKETSLLIEVDSDVTLRIDKNMVVADSSSLQK